MTDRRRGGGDPDLVRLALAVAGSQRSDAILGRAADALAGEPARDGWAVVYDVGGGRYHAAIRGPVGLGDLRRLLDRVAGPGCWMAIDGVPDSRDPGRSPITQVVAGRGNEGPALVLACWAGTAPPRHDALRTAAHLIASAAGSARVMEALLEQTCHDALTGVLNRRGLLDMLDREVARARRSIADLSVVFVDVDGFKQINDRFGHAAGDVVLSAVAGVLRESVRTTDAVGRVGGDEFVVVLPDADRQAAGAVAERLACQVNRIRLEETAGVQLSCSSGIASSDECLSREELLQAADRRMFESKRRGSTTVLPGATNPPLEIAR